MFKFKVDKMHCMGCVRKIEDSLKRFDSQIELSADIKQQTLLIKTNGAKDEISNLIENAGHPVKNIEEI